MKALLTSLILGLATYATGQVAISTQSTPPDPSAMLDISSNTRGLLIPRMTMAERGAIATPAQGLMVYQTDGSSGFYFNVAPGGLRQWVRLGDLTLPYTGSISIASDAFKVNNTGQGYGISGTGKIGLFGTSTAADGRGVMGISLGGSIGVEGQGANAGAIGVKGFATSAAELNYGVMGTTNSVIGYSGHFTGGRFYVDGNVGIGILDPAYKLHVTSDVGNSWAAGVENTNTSVTAHGMVIRAHGGQPLAVQNHSAYVMTVTQNGRVGIGNIIPDYLLHVASSEPNWAVGIHNINPLNTAHGLLIRADGGTPLLVQDKNAGSSFTILQNGYVGIGTGAPSNNLELYKASGAVNMLVKSGTKGAYLTLDCSGDYGNDYAFVQFRKNGVPKFYTGLAYDEYYISPGSTGGIHVRSNGDLLALQNIITPAGSRVGIGTLTPTVRLEVETEGAGDMVNFNNAGNYLFRFRHNSNGSAGFYMYNAANTATIFLYGDGTSYINSGNLGIGTTSPTQRLDVNGGARVRGLTTGVVAGTVSRTADGTLITGASDIRLKENIQPLQNSLSKVMQLNGVNFNYKADPQKRQSIGFVAQEFEKVIPELVFTNENDGFKGINYAEITALLVEALKELKAQVDQLKAENEALRKPR